MSSATAVFGLPKLPARCASIVMPLVLSILMTMIVSFVSMARAVGFPAGFARLWASAWAMSWLVAFPALLVLLPLVRRITAVVVRAAPNPAQ